MADDILHPDHIGKVSGEDSSHSWDEIVTAQIKQLAKTYKTDDSTAKILAKWHHDITLGIRRNEKFSPHVNGFYMIFMVHGTWYQKYLKHVNETTSSAPSVSVRPIMRSTVSNTFNMLATDIDIPDITEEYVSVSSRIRNSFVPSRNYFVSDFSISYVENVNLEVIRYHEAWHKFMNLLKRGEIKMYDSRAACIEATKGEFLEMPYTNAVWVAVFKPFTTDIQLLIKLMGVMPINMPLKQVVGNRSSTKMTVLNLQYKAADIFYKFYTGSKELLSDTNGKLFKSFKKEVLDQKWTS